MYIPLQRLNKKKKRSYDTAFGNFRYRDVPAKVYPLGIMLKTEGEYTFQIATREKALCDKLYTMKPASNQKELRTMLVDDLRINMDEIRKLDEEEFQAISEAYHSTNVSLLYKLFKKEACNNEHST